MLFLMAYFGKSLRYNIKEKLMHYRDKLNSLNSKVKAVIKLDNKLHKLAIKICYNNLDSKDRSYLGYSNYHNQRPRTNR